MIRYDAWAGVCWRLEWVTTSPIYGYITWVKRRAFNELPFISEWKLLLGFT